MKYIVIGLDVNINDTESLMEFGFLNKDVKDFLEQEGLENYSYQIKDLSVEDDKVKELEQSKKLLDAIELAAKSGKDYSLRGKDWVIAKGHGNGYMPLLDWYESQQKEV